jgi:hypothetical protein
MLQSAARMTFVTKRDGDPELSAAETGLDKLSSGAEEGIVPRSFIAASLPRLALWLLLRLSFCSGPPGSGRPGSRKLSRQRQHPSHAAGPGIITERAAPGGSGLT